MKTYKKVILTLLMSSFLTACGDDEDVLASIEDKDIYNSAFEAYLSLQTGQDRTSAEEDTLFKFIDSEALLIAIQDSGALNATELKAKIREAEKEIASALYFERFFEGKITEASLNDFYNNGDHGLVKTQAHIAHIVISTKNNKTPLERQASFEKIKKIYQDLSNGDATFAELAKKHSDDELSSQKGGDIGWLDEGAINPEFSRQAFEKLRPNEFSNPIQSNYGFHIVKLLESRKTVNQDYELIKDRLTEKLKEKLKLNERERLLNSVEVKLNYQARD